MGGCIFCEIVKGKVPSSKLFENNTALAFLDIYPAAKGHSLIIPKKHYKTMLEIPETELKEVIRVTQKIGAAAMKATKADGFTVLQNNNEAAGQVVPHLHFHVVPRFKEDGLKMHFATNKAETEALKHWQKQITGQL